MALFGDKEEKMKITKLSKENLELKEQISEYEKVFGNFEDMKKVTDRVREENKRLLQKLEENVEIKSKLENRVEELSSAINAKKENFLSKVYALESKNDEISVGNNMEISGGIRSPKNIKIGNNVVVNGSLSTKEMVTFGNDDQITGDIMSELGLKTGRACNLKGDIKSKGKVEIGENNTVQNVFSESDIIIGAGSYAKKVSSKGNVFLRDGVRIENGIEYKDAINIGQNVSIAGEIKTFKQD